MSVLIDIEMPKNCGNCPCYYETEGAWRNECQVLRKECAISEGRPSWCPLTEIKPHGRLIDADAIGLTDFEIVMCDGSYKEALKMLLCKIEQAPTIIESGVSES